MTFALLAVVDDNRVNPGLLGFVVVALLGAATWVLVRSMMRHLRQVDVPTGDPDDAVRTGDPGEAGSESDGGRP